jgi:AraC-like DNA-binding protein/quercetin dioxygenase-like cupin family protein
MDSSQQKVIRSYFENLQINLLTINFSKKVSQSWHRPESKPGYSRLYFILDGEGWIKVDGQEYYPSAGQLYYLPSNVPLAYSNISTNTFTKYWCHFTAKVGHFDLFQLLQIPFCIHVENVDKIKKLFRRLEKAHKQFDSLSSPLKARATLMEILAYYAESSKFNLTLSSSAAVSRSNQILQYIEDHLSEPLTLAGLAQVFNYNPNYFIRYFKSMFNLSPNQYISKVRIEKAKMLLIHTDSSIEAIAESVGLERFYFSKLFKQLTTFSPREYRTLNKMLPM